MAIGLAVVVAEVDGCDGVGLEEAIAGLGCGDRVAACQIRMWETSTIGNLAD